MIILAKIKRLQLLNDLFGDIYITNEVANEFGGQLPDWIKIETCSDKSRYETLSLLLDPGEASSIALALEFDNTTIIIDEKKARKIAKEFDLDVIGTIGIFLKAKELGFITDLSKLVAELEQKNFRISKKLKDLLIN